MPRKAELKRLKVAAGILRDAEGRVLICERLEQGPFYGLWEFPGGKIGADERAIDALARELAEEIGVDAKGAKLIEGMLRAAIDKGYGDAYWPVLAAVVDGDMDPQTPEE